MSRGRIVFVSVLGLLAACGLCARAFYVAFAHEKLLGGKALEQAFTKLKLRGQRGDILDRDGRTLASSVPVYSLSVDLAHLREPDDTARALAPILGRSYEKLFPLLTGGEGFPWLKRRLSPEELAAVLALGGKGAPLQDPLKERLAWRQATARLARDHALILVEERRRWYVERERAAHVLGLVDADERGIDGVEKVFDAEMRGHDLKVDAIRDRRGNTFVRKAGVLPAPSSGAGSSLVLTLHRALQWETEAALAKVGKESGAKAATAVVLEPRTGDVLALATWPAFNPNTPGAVDVSQRRNRAVVDLFEPGSTMKPFSIGTALDLGLVQPTTPMFCHYGVKVFGSGRWKHTVRDVKAVGDATLADVIRFSSNICSGKIGERLGGERLFAGLSRWYFGQKTGIELPGEARGVLRKAKPGSSSVVTNSYGYGLSVSAIQLALAYAGIANDGLVMRPRLVRELRTPAGEVQKRFEPVSRGRAISTSTARKLREMMAAVTQKGGTGTRAAIPGYLVAGKTGTALKPGPGGRYTDKRRVLFAGFAPADAPRLAAVVVIEEPSGKVTGGQLAAPAWREIVESALRHLGVQARPELLAEAKKKDEAKARAKGLPPKARAAAKKSSKAAKATAPGERAQPRVGVPDLRGFGVATALRVAAERGLTIEVEGSGSAVRQDPAPGSPLVPNATVHVTFAREDG